MGDEYGGRIWEKNIGDEYGRSRLRTNAPSLVFVERMLFDDQFVLSVLIRLSLG